MMEFYEPGTTDFYLKKTDEYITNTKALLHAKNIIWGGIYIDLTDKMETKNHKTGERAILNFISKTGNTPSHV